MNHYIFKTVLCFSLLFAVPTLTHADNHWQFQNNKHYRTLSIAENMSAEQQRIEVVEVFAYSCNHCFNFETYLDQFEKSKADYIDFKKMPVVFNDAYKTHAISTNPTLTSTRAPPRTNNMSRNHNIHGKHEKHIETLYNSLFYTLLAAPPGACQAPLGPLRSLLCTVRPPSRPAGCLSRPAGALTEPSLWRFASTLARKN